MILKDLCEIKINFPDADFWIKRRGKQDMVGEPHKEFNPDDIGIKVIATDKLVPDYLFYVLQYFWNQKAFLNIMQQGATNVLTVKQIQEIKLQSA